MEGTETEPAVVKKKAWASSSVPVRGAASEFQSLATPVF